MSKERPSRRGRGKRALADHHGVTGWRRALLDATAPGDTTIATRIRLLVSYAAARREPDAILAVEQLRQEDAARLLEAIGVTWEVERVEQRGQVSTVLIRFALPC